MTGVIYARYSSDNQREEPISDTPEGILMEAMLEGYAEYYSAELARRSCEG